MLIQNYGLFWKKENIYWGRPNNPGHLLGVLSKNITSDPVDFRDQQGVYTLYDDAFRMVYVGQAGANDQQRLFDRLKQHTKDALADRWSKFSWFGVRRVLNTCDLATERDSAHPEIGHVLNHIEAILISAAEPPHNRQGGRFGDQVEQYLQHRDIDTLGPTMTDMIKDIWKNKVS